MYRQYTTYNRIKPVRIQGGGSKVNRMSSTFASVNIERYVHTEAIETVYISGFCNRYNEALQQVDFNNEGVLLGPLIYMTISKIYVLSPQ